MPLMSPFKDELFFYHNFQSNSNVITISFQSNSNVFLGSVLFSGLTQQFQNAINQNMISKNTVSI
jgi:hypothetical protein